MSFPIVVELLVRVHYSHIPLGCRVRRCVREKVHCLCRLPNDPEKAMIQCVNCKQSYHGDCIGIALDTVNIKPWTCTTCKEYWQEFKAAWCSYYLPTAP